MGDCIAVINQKGGVGKSTTASAIGAGLTLKGYSVLYVDLDAQGNLSYSMGATSPALTSLDVMTGAATPEDASLQTPQGDLIPASPALAGADAIFTEVGKEYKLREAIETITGRYHYVILDTPPALGVLTINALTAAKKVIIPARADIYSLQGVGQLSQTIQTVKRYCNPGLTIAGILITQFNARAVLSRDMIELLEEAAAQLHTKLYSTKIRTCIALQEAQASQQDIFSYSPRSNASADYRALVEEILEG